MNLGEDRHAGRQRCSVHRERGGGVQRHGLAQRVPRRLCVGRRGEGQRQRQREHTLAIVDLLPVGDLDFDRFTRADVRQCGLEHVAALLFDQGGAPAGRSGLGKGRAGLLLFLDFALDQPVADTDAQAPDRGVAGQRKQVATFAPVLRGILVALHDAHFGKQALDLHRHRGVERQARHPGAIAAAVFEAGAVGAGGGDQAEHGAEGGEAASPVTREHARLAGFAGAGCGGAAAVHGQLLVRALPVHNPIAQASGAPAGGGATKCGGNLIDALRPLCARRRLPMLIP